MDCRSSRGTSASSCSTSRICSWPRSEPQSRRWAHLLSIASTQRSVSSLPFDSLWWRERAASAQARHTPYLSCAALTPAEQSSGQCRPTTDVASSASHPRDCAPSRPTFLLVRHSCQSSASIRWCAARVNSCNARWQPTKSMWRLTRF